ncbi:MAG: hypothetical protein K2K88_01155 [Muribaculaceae bacterium]|nr:hypothetical protein [Muribaculaceae bacterium]MDE6643948.1 hypothetical protein [Muribaculaceae bacterium]
MDRTLKIEWKGNDGAKDLVILYINDENTKFEFDHNESFEAEIPIEGNQLNIVIKVGSKSKEITCFSRIIDIDETSSYSCLIGGAFTHMGGFTLQLSKPNQEVTEEDPIYYHSNTRKYMGIFQDAFVCFCFPVYGFYKGFAKKKNWIFDLLAGCFGFILSLIFSKMAALEHATVVLGFRSVEILKYEPFSILDWLINLLVGGVSSLLGLFRLFIESFLN